MLYIWPCIVFFSWPVLLPSIARLSRKALPRIPVALAVMGLMLLAVHLNTVIHPFTLADNRHYVFYVFRILLRHAVIKYAAVPVYFTCAWLVIDAMGRMPTRNESKVRQKTKGDKGHDQTSPTRSAPEDSTRVSFVLVWLSATTLSLVTAPLVEPRYFIIPWLVWRMNIPVESPGEDSHGESDAKHKGVVSQTFSWVISNRLWVEMAWYTLINFVTCYVFLYKGFEWPQEPGNVQRFMW
jgi:alpha-1,2-glucosyltransferase